jgi:hypothetical protein
VDSQPDLFHEQCFEYQLDLLRLSSVFSFFNLKFHRDNLYAFVVPRIYSAPWQWILLLAETIAFGPLKIDLLWVGQP